MTKKLLLMTAIVATSGLFLQNNESQAQGWRTYNQGSSNRGVNSRVYGNTANRGFAQSSRSQGFRAYTPYNNYSSNFNHLHRNGFQSGYGNNFSNNRVYRNPSGYSYGNNLGYGNNYGYRNNYRTYGYQPSTGIRIGSGNTGFGNGLWNFLY